MFFVFTMESQPSQRREPFSRLLIPGLGKGQNTRRVLNLCGEELRYVVCVLLDKRR